jgi:hypothetical protein
MVFNRSKLYAKIHELQWQESIEWIAVNISFYHPGPNLDRFKQLNIKLTQNKEYGLVLLRQLFAHIFRGKGLAQE